MEVCVRVLVCWWSFPLFLCYRKLDVLEKTAQEISKSTGNEVNYNDSLGHISAPIRVY